MCIFVWMNRLLKIYCKSICYLALFRHFNGMAFARLLAAIARNGSMIAAFATTEVEHVSLFGMIPTSYGMIQLEQ